MGQLDYALIGNCQSSALIDKQGRIVWACLPRFDSEAVFASLLGDEKTGVWSILPENGDYETKQRYLQNTNVVRTEFLLKNGDRFDLIDFMPRFQERDEYYRSPQIIRIIRPVKGNPRIKVRFQPKFNYGNVEPDVVITSEGIVYRNDSTRIYLKIDGCKEFFERTTAYWRTWVTHCSIPFEYQDPVIRSALALKLHIFEDTGAIIAATTTSIPESPDGGRTWDYRYCWRGDAYFVINVLNRLGHFADIERFIKSWDEAF